MNLVSVVIPIYLSNPNQDEINSFNQCLSILGKHPICIICPNNLDISYYELLALNHKIKLSVLRFKSTYFSNIQGYSRLMLSLEFYKQFKTYEYILIYQLDAWVFRDELADWCKMGYDYIGAPWFENFGTHEDGNKLWALGNGGFSLRRIPSFIKVFNSFKPFYGLNELKKNHPIDNQFFRNLRRKLVIYLKSTGIKNNNLYFSRLFSKNEDVFWSIFLNNSKSKLNIPSIEEATKFSFEKSGKYLYQLNGNKLPFGCHAWKKYNFDNFWHEFIS